jgi:hypothetical protein
MGDVTNSPTFVDDPLSQLLVRYLAEADALQGDVHGLKLLREKYIAAIRTPPWNWRSISRTKTRSGTASAGARTDCRDSSGYTDVTLIGRGAMGVVYKAFDRELKAIGGAEGSVSRRGDVRRPPTAAC